MTRVNARSRNLGTLSSDQAETLHTESLRLLQDVGVRVDLEEARDFYTQAGASVSGDIVRFPPRLVEKALKSCPKHIILRNVNGTVSKLEDGNMLHSTGCHRLKILDYEAGSYRPSTYEDAKQLCSLADALDHIDAVTLMVSASDEPIPASEIKALEALVLNTGKLFYLAPQNLLEAQTLLDMAEIIGGTSDSVPTVILFVSPTSPLVIGTEPARILLEAARRGAVLTVGSCASAGATSPATLAGTLLLQNVETLALIVLAQLAAPGTPIIYDAASTIADLRTGVFTLGAVEYSLLTDGAIPLINRYGLPVSTTCDTDSPSIDVQNGLQKMLGYFCLIGSGVNFSKNAGSLCNGTVFSYEQMVIDNEIIALVERFFKGIRFDEESLAVELIKEIGYGGEYLSTRHTVNHCRSGEHYVSDLLNMQTEATSSMLERAHERVTEILASHSYELDGRIKMEVQAYADERIHETLKRRQI